MTAINIEKEYNYIVVKGKYYEVADKEGRPFFKLVPKKKIKERRKMAQKIAKKLKADLDAEAVIMESLMSNFTEEDLKKLYHSLFQSKIKYKPRTRKHHCVDMKVGRMIIPIVR